MRLPLALLLALGTAACGGQSGGNGAGGTPTADTAIRTGMWETQTRILSIDAPSAPPEVAEALRASISMAPAVERSCLTPAEAANPAAAIRDRTTRENDGYDCTTAESVFTGGRIRMTVNCRSTSGQPELRQAMVGSYSADTLQMAVTGETTTPATETLQSYPVSIASTVTGRRVGDCPAGATN